LLDGDIFPGDNQLESLERGNGANSRQTVVWTYEYQLVLGHVQTVHVKDNLFRSGCEFNINFGKNHKLLTGRVVTM
jgi:hypothetical protein